MNRSDNKDQLPILTRDDHYGTLKKSA